MILLFFVEIKKLGSQREEESKRTWKGKRTRRRKKSWRG